MAQGWMPGVAHRPVVNHSGSMVSDLGLILHVCEGNGSQFSWFDTPSANASSHFWVGKDGTIEQYVACGTKAWAQANGNSTYTSVETEGFTGEPLTDAQLTSLARIFEWGGWAKQLANTPGDHGLGWHGMGGAAWGGHFGCPGDIRKGQRGEILRRAGGQQPGPVVQRTMVQGDNGSDVAQLQRDLNFVDVPGFTPLKDDGDFGAKTAACVSQFQKNMGLSVDGKVGPQTLGSLHALVLQRLAQKK